MSEPRGRMGLLLINLGTPDAPTPEAVRRYLREFLSDPRVLDLPAPVRFLLLHAVILPRRSRSSAEAYRSIWTEGGSPLFVHSLELRNALRERLPEFAVELGMRYGEPSLQQALASLRRAGCSRIVAFPLYPQYAESTTGSSRAALARAARGAPALEVVEVPPFYGDEGFLEAFRLQAEGVGAADCDHVLFSFHGLPERHVRAADPTREHCLVRADCCDVIDARNASCYRAHCLATARGIADRLALPPERWSVAFQSRLGRTPWLAPYTDLRLPELAADGVRRLAVLCPSFVTDCLETLEEIGMRGSETFRAAGGEELRLVPSLDASPAWVEAAARIVERAAAG